MVKVEPDLPKEARDPVCLSVVCANVARPVWVVLARDVKVDDTKETRWGEEVRYAIKDLVKSVNHADGVRHCDE